MGIFEDRVVSCILETFNAHPAKYKPRAPVNGVVEWIPISGIAVTGDHEDNLICMAVATGMKCLPTSKIPSANGTILHDWHAETLALRAFNHVLIQECHDLASSPSQVSSILRRREAQEVSRGLQPFNIREGLKIFMYCSEAPCGDASMESVMDAQDDATPWPVAASKNRDRSKPTTMLGRECFSELGVVRRKPSRADSPTTLSKSCSDKLALKQCASILSTPASLLINPCNAYIHTLILPKDQYNEQACERAFGATGRMKPVADKTWPGGYAFRRFKVTTTELDFHFSRRNTCKRSFLLKGSNQSAVWTAQRQETLINGVLQGCKQTDLKGASMLSRRSIWASALAVVQMLGIPAAERLLQYPTYQQMKDSEQCDDRKTVKSEATREALKGWIRNQVDDFALQNGQL